MKSFDHLTPSLRLPDPAFEEMWEAYLQARPAFVAGASIELTRAQFELFAKIFFVAGRDAQLRELDIAGTLGVDGDNLEQGR